jgi:hypothetical protein
MLQDPEGNTTIRAWADPLARQLLDSYYKIQQAREEIQRLNIEIRCFVTYMRDEKRFLLEREAEVAVENPDLAAFIRKYRWQRGRFDDILMKRLLAMKKKLGARFTGSLHPGVRLAPVAPNQPVDSETINVDKMEDDESDGGEDEEGSQDGWVDDDGESDDDEGEDACGEELSEVMQGVALLGVDREQQE